MDKRGRLGTGQMKEKEPLYVCVYVPEFPVQARLRLRQEMAQSPVVVVEGDPPLEQVSSARMRRRFGWG